jgi:urea carboxylase-associated protein 2
MPDGLHITAPPPTGTLAGAREHARSLAGTAGGNGPTVPAASATDLPDEASDARIVWAETIGQGGYASRRLPRGAVLRVLDPLGDACVQLLVHNALQSAERLNVADTVKIQWQAYLGHGALLLSDMGRAMMTIIADTSERHDCLCGATVRRANEERYGDAAAGGAHPSARDLLALGLGKFGLSRRDLAPNINLFKSVRVDDTGALHFVGAARPGTHVDLRAEMDVIVALANSPHPLDDRPEYHASGVRCLAWLPRSGPPLLDPFRTSTPERTRAFENTDEYLSGVPA